MAGKLAFPAAVLLLAGSAAGSQSKPAGNLQPASQPSPERPAAASALATPGLNASHRFFDRTNLALFAGVAAVRVLDFTSTEHFRERGVNEWLLTNRIVDNKPLFAGIEAAGFAASVAVSYWLHRTGHHKLERWVSIVHMGVAGAGDARNYTLGNSNPMPPP
jgi:hypothetical protein